ncbi:MAG: P1 family peptidase [Actinomycetota bacterium]|nr:P1 family peptidase [Actinomycetota bacterium]
MTVLPTRPPMPRARARDLGLTFGTWATGPNNAITDVPGVKVGHVTLWHGGEGGGDGGSDAGTGGDAGAIARTGVTAIVPDDPATLFARPMPAASAVLNGAGELTGTIEMAEWGILETPILLTGTTAVGRVSDGVVDELFAAGVAEVVIPVVGECDDSHLDDIRSRWVTAAHARQALAAATSGPVAEGVVGAGTGMITMGFKAGVGTASRVVPGVGTVGVLLLCNFGSLADLRIGGAHVGPLLRPAATPGAPASGLAPAPTQDKGGSCLGVVFTDAPLDARQLARVARRVGLGLARVGAVAHNGSGDIFCAVSTANRLARDATGVHGAQLLADGSLDGVFSAVVDATEEAVCNALFVADTVAGTQGHVVPGLPVQRVLELVARTRA